MQGHASTERVEADAEEIEGRPLRDLREAPAHQLAILARLSNRRAQADFTARFGVNLGEWLVLANIYIHAPARLAKLSRATALDKGQLSRTVQRLVQRGWVASRAAPGNRGALDLSLTTLGSEQHDAMLKFAGARNEAMMSALTPAEQACFISCIQKLKTRLQEQEAKTAAQKL